MGKRELLERSQAIERGLVDIGRAARQSGVSAKMIRHYEAIGLLPEVTRTLANYRLYAENELHTLRFIRRARTLGFSMNDIRELLGLWQSKGRSSAAVRRIASAHIEELRAKIAELEGMVKSLEHLVHHCHGDGRPECPILEDLAGIPAAHEPHGGTRRRRSVQTT